VVPLPGDAGSGLRADADRVSSALGRTDSQEGGNSAGRWVGQGDFLNVENSAWQVAANEICLDWALLDYRMSQVSTTLSAPTDTRSAMSMGLPSASVAVTP